MPSPHTPDRFPSHTPRLYPYQPWQWLFIIEGTATIAWAMLMWVLLPETPEKGLAKKHSLFLHKPHEKELVVLRSNAAQQVMGAGMDYRQMWLAFTDPKIWPMALIFMTHGVAQNGFSVFLPTFINAFGFGPLVTQLYTMIPYFVAFVSLQAVTRMAGHWKKRAIPMFILIAVGLVGFVIQSMSIAATQIYDGPPRFFKGHGTVLGLSVICFGEIALMARLMKVSKQRKDALAAEWEARGETNPDEAKNLEEMSDAHPNYRYIY